MNQFSLSTKKSLHPPIEIVIDKKVYKSRLLSKALFDEIRKHEKTALKGDQTALYKQVQLLYGVPLEVLNKLDIRDISSLLEYTMAQINPPETLTEKEKAEKNASRSGEASSA